jgi:hypothetical protein
MSVNQSASRLLSWSHYVDLLKPAEQLLDRTWGPHDEQARADLYRQLLM